MREREAFEAALDFLCVYSEFFGELFKFGVCEATDKKRGVCGVFRVGKFGVSDFCGVAFEVGDGGFDVGCFVFGHKNPRRAVFIEKCKLRREQFRRARK